MSKLRQTIPRRKATVSLDNKTLKRSLAVHFQSYPLAFAEKKQLATASATFGNNDSTQSATPIPGTRNAEPIFSSGTRNVSNQIIAFWGYPFRV